MALTFILYETTFHLIYSLLNLELSLKIEIQNSTDCNEYAINRLW